MKRRRKGSEERGGGWMRQEEKRRVSWRERGRLEEKGVWKTKKGRKNDGRW